MQPGKAVSGAYLQTGRVRQVEFAPADEPIGASNRFAFTVGPSASLWDINNLNAPIRADKVGVAGLYAVAYSSRWLRMLFSRWPGIHSRLANLLP